MLKSKRQEIKNMINLLSYEKKLKLAKSTDKQYILEELINISNLEMFQVIAKNPAASSNILYKLISKAYFKAVFALVIDHQNLTYSPS